MKGNAVYHMLYGSSLRVIYFVDNLSPHNERFPQAATHAVQAWRDLYWMKKIEKLTTQLNHHGVAHDTVPTRQYHVLIDELDGGGLFGDCRDRSRNLADTT